jgi:peptidoglycan/xylan/chitin deacetylase (PgdA/CDA1 family)
VGVRRLLKLFDKYNIKTTWFIPGHSLETFPEECTMIRDAGHEMYNTPIQATGFSVLIKTSCRGLHGYSHENPVAMTIEQQHAILDKTYKDLTAFCGKPPRGNVAPWWEASQEGAELMLKYGVEYGSFAIYLIAPHLM